MCVNVYVVSEASASSAADLAARAYGTELWSNAPLCPVQSTLQTRRALLIVIGPDSVLAPASSYKHVAQGPQLSLLAQLTRKRHLVRKTEEGSS